MSSQTDAMLSEEIAMFKSAAEGAASNLEKDGYITPCLMIEREGSLVIMVAPWTSDEQKYMFFDAMQMMLSLTKPRFTCFVVESWFAVEKTVEGDLEESIPERRKRLGWGNASECPDRKEIVMLTCCLHGERMMFAMADMDRSSGKPRIKVEDLMSSLSEQKIEGAVPDMLRWAV